MSEAGMNGADRDLRILHVLRSPVGGLFRHVMDVVRGQIADADFVAKARAGRAAGARDNMALVGILSTQLWMEQFNAHAQVRN